MPRAISIVSADPVARPEAVRTVLRQHVDPIGRGTRTTPDQLLVAGAFSLRPHDGAYYPFQLGHFRFKAGDVDGAIESLQTALEIAPVHPTPINRGVIEELATVFAAIGDVESVRTLPGRLEPAAR